MSKDKKKSKPDDKVAKGKKRKKSPKSGVAAKTIKGAGKGLKALSENPMVADIVAAALVGMAAALKDTEKARKLANQAGDQLGKVGKRSTKQGGAMWDMALDIGRQTLESLAEEGKRGKRGKSR